MRTACIGLLTFGIALAQPLPRKFEVASIRQSVEECRNSMSRTDEELVANSNRLQRLLEMAFQTKQVDLTRVPESLRNQCFDVAAKAAQRITGEQHWEMLRALLEERFHLTYHRETKDAQVYALTLVKPGAKLGPRITESPVPDCPATVTSASYCGVSVGPSLMIGQRTAMTRIAQELSVFAGRPVLNRTGLTGHYDFQLSWTPDQGLSENDKLAGNKVQAAGITLDQSGASFFTAVEEQLGLKLQPQRGQIEVLVIDRAETPSEN